MSREITATSGAPDIEDGTYGAVVKSVEETEGKFGAQYRLNFEIVGHTQEDGNPTLLAGWCSQKLSPKAKLREWATALTGAPISNGQTIDVDDFIGKACRVQIINEESDGEERPKITNVLRARTGGKGMKALTDVCACGAEVSSYTDGGVPLCEQHAQDGAA